MDSSATKIENEFTFEGDSISHPRAAAFGVGSLATVIFIIAPQILLLFFMTDVLGIPAAAAGLGIGVLKTCEVVSDILIGTWSDRHEPRVPARRRLMILGALAFPLGFALIFAAPEGSGWWAALCWVLLASLLATVAYTTFSVPYITLVGEMTDCAAMRLRLTAWRMAFVAVGVLVAGAGAPLLVDLAGGGVTGYRFMAAIFAVLMIVAAFGAVSAVPVGNHAAPIFSAKPGLAGVRRAVLGAEEYRVLWVSYVCQMVGISVNAALLPYTVYLAFRADASAVATIFAIMTFATLAAMPLAVVAARRLGTVSAYVMSLIVSAVGLVALATGQLLALWPALAGAAVFGLGQAGATSLPFAMLPQALDQSDRDLARVNAGALTGLWVAGEKLGLAIGAACAGVLLSAIGYDSAAPTQQAGTIAAIPWLFGPLPAAFMLLSAVLLRPLLRTPLNYKVPQ